MGAATSMQGAKCGQELISLLRREASLPRDLSDLGADVDVVRARDEVTRLRRLLRHVMADETFVVTRLRPPSYRDVQIPIPSREELQEILDSQVKKKAVLDARARKK